MNCTAANVGFAARLAGHWSNCHFIATLIYLGWTNIVGLLFVNLYLYIFNQQRFRAGRAMNSSPAASHARYLQLIMTSQTELNLLAQDIKVCCDKLVSQKQEEWVRYLKKEMTPEESEVYNRESKKEYFLFTENDCGKLKIQFLNKYLQSNKEIQLEFKTNLISLFKSGEFAVLAVRRNSKELIDFALDSFESSIESNNDFRDDIVSLTLVYNSIKRMGLNADEIFIEYANNSNNQSAKKHIADFISRKDTEKTLWCMGYEIGKEQDFGFVWIGGNSDYKAKNPKKEWWKLW